MIMDSLASLALATETPKPELLMRPPYRRNEYIISRKMVKHVLGQAIMQGIVVLIVLFAGHTFIPEQYCDAGSDYVGKVGGDYCGLSSTEELNFLSVKSKLETVNPDFYKSLLEKWNND